MRAESESNTVIRARSIAAVPLSQSVSGKLLLELALLPIPLDELLLELLSLLGGHSECSVWNPTLDCESSAPIQGSVLNGCTPLHPSCHGNKRGSRFARSGAVASR